MDKQSFLFYYEYRQYFSLLTDAELGKLTRAIMDYEEFGTKPLLKGKVQMAFSAIRLRLDFDRQKYTTKCVSNRENGKKGGRPSGQKPKEPNALSGFSKEPKKAEYDLDLDLDKDLEHIRVFEALWLMYPKKKGKGQVSETQKKKLLKIGLDEMTRAVGRCQKDKEGTDMQYWQNGSTFFNSGYVDYLDSNWEQDHEMPTQEKPTGTGGRVYQE